MKPETKRIRRRSNDEEGGGSPFNLSSLKHAIEAVDSTAKENSINLSSLSAALSAASREMKQTDQSKRKRVRGSRKKKNKKKLLIGTKPETDAELQRWLSNFGKPFKQSLPEKLKQSFPKNPNYKTTMEPQICEFNTDFTMNYCSESFRI